MDNIKTFNEYIELLTEANNSETIKRFNNEFQPLYDKLSDQVSDEDLNVIKARLFMHRKYLNMYDGLIKKRLLNNPYSDYVNDILNHLDGLRKENNIKANKLDKDTFDVLINRFPKHLQNTIRNIITGESVSADKLKSILYFIFDYKSAIEKDNMFVKLENAKSIKEIDEILKQVKINVDINSMVNMIPGTYRNKIKNNVENIKIFNEYAHKLLSVFDNKLYRNFMKNSSTYPNADAFLKEFSLFVEQMLWSREDLISNIKSYNGDGIELEYVDDKYVVAWVYSRKALIQFGSTAWCVSYTFDDSFYIVEVASEMDKFYIIWDYTKTKYDSDFMFGFVLDKDSDWPFNCYDMLDDWCYDAYDEDEKFEKYMHKLTPEQYKKYEEYITEKGYKYLADDDNFNPDLSHDDFDDDDFIY